MRFGAADNTVGDSARAGYARRGHPGSGALRVRGSKPGHPEIARGAEHVGGFCALGVVPCAAQVGFRVEGRGFQLQQ
jgi:hypothetical protein